MAPWATASAPRRDRTNASAGMPSATRSASSPAASAVAVRRTGAPASPRSVVSGGSQSPNVSDPRGAVSAVTATASSPVSSRAQVSGSLTVAEQSTKTGGRLCVKGGLLDAWCSQTRRSLRRTCATWDPKTPR